MVSVSKVNKQRFITFIQKKIEKLGNHIFLLWHQALGPNTKPDLVTQLENAQPGASTGIRNLVRQNRKLSSVKRNLLVECTKRQMKQRSAGGYQGNHPMVRVFRFKNRCMPTQHFNNHLIQACRKLMKTNDANLKSVCLILLNKLLTIF